MRTSVQKPVLALMSAACIAAPAVVGAPHAAAAASLSVSHAAVALSADATLFDPVPAAARLVDLNIGGVNTLATADIGTLVDLLTFPYHNVYAVGSAVGRAANAGIQALGLPLSLAYFLATNAGDATIQTYLDGVQTNVNTAIPGIVKAIQDEIAYDLALFNAVFGGPNPQVQATALAAPTAGVTAPAADVGRLVDLLTFPYHNVYAVGSAVGRAANAGIQVLGLPLSLGFFLLTNASDTTIQNYLDGVQTNVDNAIPGIVKAIQDEIAYDQQLFADFFGGASAADAVTAEALAAPTEGVALAAPTDSIQASAAGIDVGTLVDLATFPYHNAYAVGSAFGKAANAGIQVAGLPLSLGYYLLTNASDTTIQSYLDGVQDNVNNAIPGIVKAIQGEISYDQKLFAKVFGGATTSAASTQKAAALDTADVKTATDGADLGKAGAGAVEGTGKTTVDGEPSQDVAGEETTGTSTDPDTGAPQSKPDVRHAFDLAAAAKALGGSLNGIGKHASGKSNDAKQDDTKQGDAKDDTAKDGTKQDDAKQGDTTKGDTTKDAGQGAAKADGGDSGQTGGRHRLAG